MEARKDILIEGAIMGLARNLALERFLRVQKDDPVKDPSNRGESAQTGNAL